MDIAGLVKGASKGEGLGNKFLSHIREVDAIVHVVRCFENENITHVENSIDPIRDIETINLELILSDIDAVQKRMDRVKNAARGGSDKGAAAVKDCYRAFERVSGRMLEGFSEEEREQLLAFRQRMLKNLSKQDHHSNEQEG